MVKIFTTGAYRLLSLALQAIAVGFGLLLVWQGKNMVNAAIARSPEVAALHSDLSSVHNDLDQAKTAAQAANAKADTSLATQARIFEILKQDRDDSQAIKISLATLIQRVDDTKDQLNRVEAKQDSTGK